ncbi:MAG: TraB/GumN family protein [Euryarchaeota archaeon]|nr:TraB/GumN family protein [Euryarchaeota archaeon]
MSERGADNILLIGTGHVLEKSVKEVEEVIERERPDVVAVELCEGRYKALKGEVQEVSPREMLSSGNPFMILTHWLLAYVQRKMGTELGIEPGADMMAAINKAEELGCEIALIDRPIQITMRRFWKKMRFWEKLKMLFSIIFSIATIGRNGTGEEENEEGKASKGNKKLTMSIMGTHEEIALDRLTDDDVVTQLMKELREFSPGAATALLDERDAYIARSLLDIPTQTFKKSLIKNDVFEKSLIKNDRTSKKSLIKDTTQATTQTLEKFDQTASQQPLETWDQTTPIGRKIVAVVGAGHVAGIKKFLSQPELLPTKEELCSLPKKRFNISIGNLLGIGIGVAFLIILLAIVFAGISFDILLRAFLWWFIINGVLSAAGVVIARGHPLSAFTAFCVAWLTSLNLFLAAGWFAGLAEVHLRKPSLEDAKSMLNVESLRELMSNRLFKVILVAALANIGSVAGTFIGAYVVWQVIGINIHDIWEGLKVLL